ncbi:glycosyltransferase family 4 protein [Pseudoxanthomonas helianthi]|uniref:Glycosyltransferase family 4 protein n=1 Tax=Pseudoxanthomonas helianthi TaxID=1453541 RepID=A0A940X3E1_9GAMM|nr:glycosyltransferase family 4 protein [Pseudoxanthomonas helianthi]MBP3984516.1 glycosyltransferase family 4 protein [Pseudoxanthomonas helianthi]
MERLNAKMFEALLTHDEMSALIGPAGSSGFVKPGTNVKELPSGATTATILASITKGIAMARHVRPDVVLAGSGLAAPAAVSAARVCGAIPAVYLHGLDIIAPSRLYRAIWLPCIRRCQRVLVNSANTRRLAIEAGVHASRINIVHPGADLPDSDPEARGRFRARYGIDEATPVLLSVGRMTTRKGLAEFVARAFPAIVDERPETQLIIIGDEAIDALHRGTGAGFGRVRAAALEAGILDSVRWLGPCSDRELSDAYRGADVHVFPIRDIPGDVEGFGMVAIEAAAHGLATVAFNVGGVSDAIMGGESGHLISAGDYSAFANAVIEVLSEGTTKMAAEARAFAAGFSWDRFGGEVVAALGRPGD